MRKQPRPTARMSEAEKASVTEVCERLIVEFLKRIRPLKAAGFAALPTRGKGYRRT